MDKCGVFRNLGISNVAILERDITEPLKKKKEHWGAEQLVIYMRKKNTEDAQFRLINFD